MVKNRSIAWFLTLAINCASANQQPHEPDNLRSVEPEPKNRVVSTEPISTLVGSIEVDRDPVAYTWRSLLYGTHMPDVHSYEAALPYILAKDHYRITRLLELVRESYDKKPGPYVFDADPVENEERRAIAGRVLKVYGMNNEIWNIVSRADFEKKPDSNGPHEDSGQGSIHGFSGESGEKSGDFEDSLEDSPEELKTPAETYFEKQLAILTSSDSSQEDRTQAAVAMRFLPRKLALPRLQEVYDVYRATTGNPEIDELHTRAFTDAISRTLVLFGRETFQLMLTLDGVPSSALAIKIISSMPEVASELLPEIEEIAREDEANLFWAIRTFSELPSVEVRQIGMPVVRLGLTSLKRDTQRVAIKYFVRNAPEEGVEVAREVLVDPSSAIHSRISAARLVRKLGATAELAEVFIFQGMYDELAVLDLPGEILEDGLFASYTLAQANLDEIGAAIAQAIEMSDAAFLERSNRDLSLFAIDEIKSELSAILRR